MTYKALIWDLDGTLIESLPGIAKAVNLSLREHGFPTHPQKVIRNFIGDGSWMLIRRAISTAQDETINRVHKSFTEHYPKVWQQHTTIFEGITALILDCQSQGIKHAIISNKPHLFTLQIVATVFPQINFEIVMGQQDGIAQKPAIDGTEICIEKLGVSTREILFIGDSAVDLKTAKAAGISSAAVTWGYHDKHRLKKEKPTYLISTVQELHNLVLT